MKTFNKKLEYIFHNKKLGSSELVIHLNELYRIFHSDIKLIKSSIPLIEDKLGHFSAITGYLSRLNTILSFQWHHREA